MKLVTRPLFVSGIVIVTLVGIPGVVYSIYRNKDGDGKGAPTASVASLVASTAPLEKTKAGGARCSDPMTEKVDVRSPQQTRTHITIELPACRSIPSEGDDPGQKLWLARQK